VSSPAEQADKAQMKKSEVQVGRIERLLVRERMDDALGRDP
jgi:hypothetical protein